MPVARRGDDRAVGRLVAFGGIAPAPPENGPVWVVIVAAGSGSRYGGLKQYEVIAGRRVIDWSIATAREVAHGVVLVVPATEMRDEPGADVVVAGGSTRSASVRAGLAAVPDAAQIVVVHDGPRPAASPELFRAVISAVRAGADGAIPGLPVTDTVKRVRDGVVVETLVRAELMAVQTPQAFDASVLRRAHESEPDATDDAAVVEMIGGTVNVVPGETTNRKITERADLDDVSRYLEARR